MKCKDCKFWQGTRYSKWGDCYRVVASLEPDLLGCYRLQDDEDLESVEIYFRTPFDPHDLKEYWTHHPFVRKLYKNAVKRAETMWGIRLEPEDGEVYFQTMREFDCEDIQ